MSCKFDNIPQVKDYEYLTSKQQIAYFGRTRPKYDLTLSDWLLGVLKDDVLLHIPFRDAHKFKVEIINNLSRNIAYFKLYPFRYDNKIRNVIAPALMLIQHRLLRVRSGHKLPPKSLRPVSKKEFKKIIDELEDNSQLDVYSEHFVRLFHWRERNGYVVRSEL